LIFAPWLGVGVVALRLNHQKMVFFLSLCGFVRREGDGRRKGGMVFAALPAIHRRNQFQTHYSLNNTMVSEKGIAFR
jgi:hypothetical protein